MFVAELQCRENLCCRWHEYLCFTLVLRYALGRAAMCSIQIGDHLRCGSLPMLKLHASIAHMQTKRQMFLPVPVASRPREYGPLADSHLPFSSREIALYGARISKVGSKVLNCADRNSASLSMIAASSGLQVIAFKTTKQRPCECAVLQFR